MLLTYLLNYAIIISQQRKTQNKKPEPQSLDSTHGTGTQLKKKKGSYIIAKVKQNEKN